MTTTSIAQDADSLQVGSRIRVTHHCASRAVNANRRQYTCLKHVGNVASLDATGILVALGSADSLEVAWAATRLLEVSDGRETSHRFRGGLVGMVVGAPVGWGMGLLVELIACGTACGGSITDTGVFVGAGVGLALGALLGSRRRETWVRVPLERLRFSWIPADRGRYRGGISVPF